MTREAKTTWAFMVMTGIVNLLVSDFLSLGWWVGAVIIATVMSLVPTINSWYIFHPRTPKPESWHW